MDTVTAKTSTGSIEATPVIHAAHRTEVIVQLKSLLATAPEHIRAEYRDLATTRLVPRLAAARTRTALKRVAARYQQLDEEVTAHDADLAGLVETVKLALV